jgi:hypothetical protein
VTDGILNSRKKCPAKIAVGLFILGKWWPFEKYLLFV